MDSLIASRLWRWAFAAEDERRKITDDLSSPLEFYLCGLLHEVPHSRAKGWWCDGVIGLSIRKLSRTAFQVIGIAWYPYQQAVFELEFYFPRRRDTTPERILFRFGDRPLNGKDRRALGAGAYDNVLARRPGRDDDWVIAVEITPSS